MGRRALHFVGVPYISYWNIGIVPLMGSLLQIRGVPDDARRALKARAAARGESLNRYLLDLIERDVARPTVAEVLDRAAWRAERARASAVGVIEEARGEREGAMKPRRS
jgi:antitoxin FitA